MDLGIPSQKFIDGAEPSGDRVNHYFKLNTIATVLAVLKPEEIEQIRPTFGKFLDVYAKPTFSGKLAHFLLTRQLDIGKKYEVWFIFAGKPIRFSLREFGIVTGLDCGPLPNLPKEKQKAPPGVTPFWFELFGGESNVTGERLTKMLKRSRSLPSETRIKYACLMLVDHLLCRRSYTMKIPKEHVEMIRDLQTFLSYPWGRYAFNMTISSIRSRSVAQLAQSTVAVQGFVHAIQLVFLEAVPRVLSALGECVDPESGDEDERLVICLKLDKVWGMDCEKEVQVMSILPENVEPADEVVDYSWPDEVNDIEVERLEKLINEGTMFMRDMFVGGIRGDDVPVDQLANAAGRGKRKTRANAPCKGRKSTEPSGSKGTKRPRSQGKVDKVCLDPRLVSAVSAQLKEDIRGDLKVAEANLDSTLKVLVPQLVADCFNAHMAANDLARRAAGFNGPTRVEGDVQNNETNASEAAANVDPDESSESETVAEDSTGVDTGSENRVESVEHMSGEFADQNESDANTAVEVHEATRIVRIRCLLYINGDLYIKVAC